MAKTKTSTAVKRRWLDKNMSPLNTRLPKDLAETFRARVAERGDTIAGVIRAAVERYLEGDAPHTPVAPSTDRTDTPAAPEEDA